MSEWSDNKAKPASSVLNKLRADVEKANPRREQLTKKEEEKLAKLEVIADKLRRGKNVPNRNLKVWLTADEYAEIEADWQMQRELRQELKDKPTELARYDDTLKKATFYRNRAEGYSCKGKSSTAKGFYAKSEQYCESAFEILQEILHADEGLRMWLDRPISFEAGSDIGADLELLPRLITSRSQKRQNNDARKSSKQEVKLAVVERAMFSIGRDDVVGQIGAGSKLQSVLNETDPFLDDDLGI